MSVTRKLVPAGSWRADGLHSTVGIEVRRMGVSTFRAGFGDLDASLLSGPDGAELEGTVRVESFDVQDEQLRAQVMSPEFLDAERHPELAFRSTALREEEDGLIVEGELTIRGVSLPVDANGRLTDPVVDPYGNELLAMTLETVVDRTDFGLGWQMELPDGGQVLANDVKLVASLEFIKEKA
jgi:polyisoprenoid-binding protein YceI